MENLKISDIIIYPIKSLGGISLKNAVVEKRGLKYDRRWMLVNENGVFLTQRKFREMALLQVEITDNGLKVSHKTKDIQPIEIPFNSEPLEHLRVQVWDDTCTAFTISDSINQWFSDVLERDCRLVYMPDDSLRQLDRRYAKEGEITGFADGYPVLILGESALEKLNKKLENAIPMNRFRPNLVFSGGSPNEEDTWKELKIGQINFYGAKPCARCIMTTINQDNAVAGKEPLKTLSTYRKVGKKILFGQNLIPRSLGESVKVGDVISISKYSEL